MRVRWNLNYKKKKKDCDDTTHSANNIDHSLLHNLLVNCFIFLFQYKKFLYRILAQQLKITSFEKAWNKKKKNLQEKKKSSRQLTTKGAIKVNFARSTFQLLIRRNWHATLFLKKNILVDDDFKIT